MHSYLMSPLNEATHACNPLPKVIDNKECGLKSKVCYRLEGEKVFNISQEKKLKLAYRNHHSSFKYHSGCLFFYHSYRKTCHQVERSDKIVFTTLEV